jgi:hypothetical protein
MPAKLARKRVKKQPSDYVGLRGGIEVMLKNAFTGEVILHEKGFNAVLNGGRNALMTRVLATASQTSILVPNIVIGSGTTTANASDSGPLAYFTWKTGGFATTAGAGATAPLMLFTGSWESTELTVTGFNVIREFCLGLNTVSNSSNASPYLCRYVSSANINATTSNQLLISYTISF